MEIWLDVNTDDVFSDPRKINNIKIVMIVIVISVAVTYYCANWLSKVDNFSEAFSRFPAFLQRTMLL